MTRIFENVFATSEVADAFGETKILQAMLRFEVSLARAQARVGLIPEVAAQSIIGTCKIELFDVPKIVRDSARAGNVAIPLIQSLRETVGLFNKDAADFVHYGSSYQDAIDTALAMVTRDALLLIESDVSQVVHALLALAERHATDPVLERRQLQPSSVTTFGVKCAGWAMPLVRVQQRLRASAGNALSLQFGSSVETLDQMKGKGSEVIALMAEDLALIGPHFESLTQADEWVGLGCELGLLVGILGRMAKGISLMGQFEVGEITEPNRPVRGGASLLPIEYCQVACMVAIKAAQLTPLRVAALLGSLPGEQDQAVGNWQSELTEWKGLLMSAHESSRAMAMMLSGLDVNTRRMRANLDAVRAGMPSKAADQWFNTAHAQYAGELARSQVATMRARMAVNSEN